MSGSSSRVYRLAADEPLAVGLERIARGRIDNALDELQGRGAGSFADSVHEARKDLKKARAVLRLVRDELSESVYRTEMDRLRDAARLLSPARDAEVRLETIDRLRAAQPGAPSKPTLAEYVRTLERERGERAGDRANRARLRDEVVAELERASAALDRWGLADDGWGAIAPGLRRAYRRGRNRLTDVESDPGAEQVHEWRKRAKDLWYHLRILAEAWPPVLDETAREVHALTDELGDHHDLAVLADHAGSHRDRFDERSDLDALAAAIRSRQAELLRSALGRGRRIYAEPPKAFVRRLEGYWSAWRDR